MRYDTTGPAVECGCTATTRLVDRRSRAGDDRAGARYGVRSRAVSGGTVAAALWVVAACGFPGAGGPEQPSPASGNAAVDAAADSARDDGGHAVLPLPVGFYTPETRLALGVTLLHTYRGDGQDRPAVSAAEVIYTQNRQIIASVNTDVYTDVHRIFGGLGYVEFPDRFYGIGNDSDVDEAFTSRRTTVNLGLERQVRPSLYLGGSFYTRRTSLIDVEEDGKLAEGTVPGSAAGTLLGIGVGVTYDTRDDVIAASHGAYARLHIERFDEALGGDFGFTRLDLDLRRYFPTYASHVLALRGYTRLMTEGAPFYALGALGGSNLLRGYRQGRYRDRHLVAAQAEYRLPVWWRFGVAAFASVGQVAGELAAMSLDGFHYAAGAGLRILIIRRDNLNLRLDLGFSPDGSGFYITGSEAF